MHRKLKIEQYELYKKRADLGCSRRATSSCSTSGPLHVSLVVCYIASRLFQYMNLYTYMTLMMQLTAVVMVDVFTYNNLKCPYIHNLICCFQVVTVYVFILQ